MSESTDDFLKKISAEREPLSKEEQQEAMKVSSQIRRKARELAGNRSQIGLPKPGKTDPFERISIIFFDERRDPKYPNAELLIVNSGLKESEGEHSEFQEWYFFAPDRVDKEVTNAGISVGDQFERLAKGGPEAIGQIAELSTGEIYHPDKADLTALLGSLSSATPKV